MAVKPVVRKILESHRSGKYTRKAVCSGHGLGALLLLVFSAGMLCYFMSVDMKTFYDGKDFRDLILQGDAQSVKASSSSALASYESEEGTLSSRAEADVSVIAAANSSTETAAVNSSREAPTASLKPAADGGKTSAHHLPEPDSKGRVPYFNTSIHDSEETQVDSQVEDSSEDAQTENQGEVLAMPGNDRSTLAGCDLYHGQWVYDESYPLYRSRNCPFVDTSFRCEENGRPDQDFMKYRWQPHDCDLPRFDPRAMLEKLRNQRLVYVGDSLGRNQWESMLCMLSEVVHNKSSIYEVKGRSVTKRVGELVFLFEEYNCTVEYLRDPFLVNQERPTPDMPSNVTSVLKIDEVSWSAKLWHGANIMVFNCGHWWSWEKIGRAGGRFYQKDHFIEISNEKGFKTGLKTWALWMEKNLDPATQVFFRSFASIHFRGGAWNRGGHCSEAVKPLTDEEVKKEQPIPWTNKHIKAAINKNIKVKRSAVEYMDVTTLTNFRADGHAGLYGRDTKIHGLPLKHRQDCSHFCLPGVPDTWNEVLYASLLARGQGVWGEPV